MEFDPIICWTQLSRPLALYASDKGTFALLSLWAIGVIWQRPERMSQTSHLRKLRRVR